MRVGLPASVAGHAIMIFWGVLGASTFSPSESEPIDNILVELVPVAEESKTRLGSRNAEEFLEEAAPAESDVVTDVPRDEPNEEDAQLNNLTESALESKIEENKPPEVAELEQESPEPEASEPETVISATEPAPSEEEQETEVAEPLILPKPKVKQASAKEESSKTIEELAKENEWNDKSSESDGKEFKLQEVAALLNKVAPVAGSDSISDSKSSIGDFKEESVEEFTLSEKAVLKRHMSECWRQLSGTEGASSVIVKVEMELNRQGEVTNFEFVNERSDQLYQAAAQRAKSAAYKCSPYNEVLPAEKYREWKAITFTFNPKEIAGG